MRCTVKAKGANTPISGANYDSVYGVIITYDAIKTRYNLTLLNPR